MSRVLTNNSHLNYKVKLRLDFLPQKNIRVLNAYAGDNKVWETVKKKFRFKINIDLIEIKDKNIVYMKGDNLKYLMSLSLNKYDIIDLDAYGAPIRQLNIVFNKKFKGIIFITYIQVMFGGFSRIMLNNLGYSSKMIKKIPTLFYKNPFEKLKNFLYLYGIKTIIYYKLNRKIYAYINSV